MSYPLSRFEAYVDPERGPLWQCAHVFARGVLSGSAVALDALADVARALIAGGAVEKAAPDGRSLLLVACEAGHSAVAEMLIAHFDLPHPLAAITRGQEEKRSAVAQKYNAEMKKELKSWFDFLDKDGSGEITVEELEDAATADGAATARVVN